MHHADKSSICRKHVANRCGIRKQRQRVTDGSLIGLYTALHVAEGKGSTPKQCKAVLWSKIYIDNNMLAPKRTQYRKYQKGTLKNIAHNLNKLQFGLYGLKCCESAIISAKTIEAVRRSIRRELKRVGFVWIRIFPDKPVTRKPAEVRMGKGKGNLSFWICKLRPGQIVYEMDGIPLHLAKKAATVASSKLPFNTQFIIKNT